ncbi:MAG: trigger factor [Gammaproteobacteria bacterium]
MQVSVEKTSDLSRKMTVRVPEELIQQKIDSRLKSLAREVKLDGFRPGKVPPHVIKKLYGSRVRSEITGDLIQSSYFDALKSENLRPAGPPHIVPVEQQAEKGGFEYVADFEVYPEVPLEGIERLEVKRPVAEVGDEDLDGMIEKLREQKKEWKSVDRASRADDRVTIHFSGESEGENFTNGKVEDYQVVIGSNQMIPGFEDNLDGLVKGQTKTFEIAFPEEYGNDKLAGKKAVFEVEMVAVEEPVIPEIDADFIKAYGVESGDLGAFREDVRRNLQRELDQIVKNRLKNNVMDAICDKIELNVPAVLIDQEIDHLMKPYLESAQRQNKKLEDLELPRDKFEDQARKRVVLGLILAEIIRKNEIKVDADRVRSTIEEMAKNYERPEDVVNWYYGDKQRLGEVEQMVLEDQTVEWIVGQIKVTDEKTNFTDLTESRN